MNEENLIKYYNKFNEDKRLNTRHGQVEFITSLKYIHECLEKCSGNKILDIGAGTGKYSIALANEGYDVTAIELVKHNLRVIQSKSDLVKAYQGNAIDLSKFSDKSFDIVLLFGPMYHLCNDDDKLKALSEAKRVLKDDGFILVAYCMNDYCVITHCFKDGNILSSIDLMDDEFHIKSNPTDLYSVVRIEDIDHFNDISNLKRVKIITPDGPSNYLRPFVNKLSDEEFNLYIKYHLATCERLDMIGAAAHTLDILQK